MGAARRWDGQPPSASNGRLVQGRLAHERGLPATAAPLPDSAPAQNTNHARARWRPRVPSVSRTQQQRCPAEACTALLLSFRAVHAGAGGLAFPPGSWAKLRRHPTERVGRPVLLRIRCNSYGRFNLSPHRHPDGGLTVANWLTQSFGPLLGEGTVRLSGAQRRRSRWCGQGRRTDRACIDCYRRSLADQLDGTGP